MSSQYLNQSVPNQGINIRVNDAIIDNNLTVGGALFKESTTVSQSTSPTTSINVNYARNIIINTQIFSTPHSNNNSTSFLLTNYAVTGNVNIGVSVNLLKYSGTTGLPIVVGKISNTDNNEYEITIINLHQNENLSGTFKLSVELLDFN
jgi:hypothetical protein